MQTVDARKGIKNMGLTPWSKEKVYNSPEEFKHDLDNAMDEVGEVVVHMVKGEGGFSAGIYFERFHY